MNLNQWWKTAKGDELSPREDCIQFLQGGMLFVVPVVIFALVGQAMLIVSPIVLIIIFALMSRKTGK